MFDNSSTVPYCIVMERQKENEMVCAYNLIISRYDGERKNHIDDDGRPAATADDRDE